MIKEIASRTHATIKHIVKLHSNKERLHAQQFIAEGVRVCTTLMQSPIKLIQLYITQKHLAWAQQLVNPSLITLVTDSVMAKISTTTTASGVLGIFAMPHSPSFDQLSPGAVLADITDPGNMGTLIRSCAAMNKKTVVIVEGVDPWNPKVVQASAGAIGLVTIIQSSWHKLVQHKGNLELIALVVKNGVPIQSATSLQNALIVIGNEAHGIAQEWLPDCTRTITLPMPGNVESFNAAVAGSIAFYIAWHKPI